MALASSRPLALLGSLHSLLIPALLVGCSEGEDTDTDSFTTAVSLASTASVDESAGSTAPTTAEQPAGTTTDASTTTTGDEPTGSSTTAADTTTGEDSSTGGTTGPICDPGQVGCICIDGTCADGLVCELGVCEPAAMVCPGDLEPGDDDEQSAKNVGDITDNDNDQFGISGVLSGAADTDWYTYHGSDKAGYVAEPTLELIQGNLRLCQFLACDEGGPAQTELTCPEGSKFAISPTLRPGCCAATSFSINDFNCSGAADDVTVWIRVDKPTVDECTSYELKVNF
jgi:hypothetical protein